MDDQNSLQPIVSVIIPTYNRKDKVVEAIKSVVDQDFDNVEIIVVDDGSTDGTAEFLKSLNLPVIVITQLNGGVSNARNTGIRASKGKYIAFLDSDDLWLPGKLEAQVKFLENHPDIPIVYTDQYLNIDGQNLDKTRFERNAPKDNMLLSAFVDLTPIHTSTVMARSDLFDELGMFSEDLHIHEDSELWNRISNHYKLGFIPKVLGVYRWQEGVEHVTSPKYRQKFIDEGRKYLQLYRNNKKRPLTPEEQKSCDDSEKIMADIEKDLNK
jgi:glycosyltransferase involved in cell wall biosynthesis